MSTKNMSDKNTQAGNVETLLRELRSVGEDHLAYRIETAIAFDAINATTQPAAPSAQPSDAADVDDLNYWRGRAIYAERKLATPPTAQRHDEGSPASPNDDRDVSAVIRHGIFFYEVDFGDEGKGCYVRLHDFNRVVEKLESAAHGAGAAVEADPLYRMFRALVDAGGPSTIARHGVERGGDEWASTVRAGMLAIERRFHPDRFDWIGHPPQQRSEQVAGSGGVDYSNLIDAAQDATTIDVPDGRLYRLREALDALSKRDDGAGVTNEMVARATMAMIEKDRNPGAFTGLGMLAALEAALHPEQAKDGETG